MLYNVFSFPYDEIAKLEVIKRPKGRRKKKGEKNILDCITAFDIETTSLDDIDQAIMYIWQWHFRGIGTCIGRTWEEFLDFQSRLKHVAPDGSALVVYVHNLSFEFSFLKGIWHFQPDEVFAMSERKVLKCDMNGFLEFRCSYIHSNMSLDEFTKKMGVKHTKLSGDEFDYAKKRYPWTELTERELQYCINDVVGLTEALAKEMEIDGDTLQTIPLTSTGYVRRQAKAAMYKTNIKAIKAQLPDIETYTMEREAFRGGDTHANRFYSGRIVKNVLSADRSSSYPDVICNCKFPIEKFKTADVDTRGMTRLLNQGKALLVRLAMFHVELSDIYNGAPYLSRDKCRRVTEGRFDNGRILSAEYLETTLTDIDLEIVLDEYNILKVEVIDLKYSRYAKLPQPLIDLNILLYRQKTELKGVPGQEVYYMKSKNKLNSIYGMTAQKSIREEVIFNGIDFDFVKNADPLELLAEANKKAWLNYAWGVWVTAWARYRLREGIRIAGDDFVYCDTDSVKYVGMPGEDNRWGDYNFTRKTDSKASGACAKDPSGVTHYMGVYEPDGFYTRFVTYGAKKYAYEDKDGVLHITVAGVNKRRGAQELLKYGGLDAFKPGFVFRDAGGLEAVYNDLPEINEYEVDGHKLKITSNVLLRESTYTLGMTQDYIRLLTESADIFRRGDI